MAGAFPRTAAVSFLQEDDSVIVSTGYIGWLYRDRHFLLPLARSETNPHYLAVTPIFRAASGVCAAHLGNKSDRRVSPVSTRMHRFPTPLRHSLKQSLLFGAASEFGRDGIQVRALSIFLIHLRMEHCRRFAALHRVTAQHQTTDTA